MLLDPKYPRFLGKGRNSRRSFVSCSCSSSSSESEEEEESKVEPVVSNVGVNTTFIADLVPDECEVLEGEDFIEIWMGSDFGEEVSTHILLT